MTLHDARTIHHSAQAVPISTEVSSSIPKSYVPKTGTAKMTELTANETAPVAPFDSETVPLALYQAVQQELIRYKAHFGELPTQPPEAHTVSEQGNDAPSISESELQPSLSQPETPPLPVDPTQSREEAEALLQILAVNDQDLAGESVDLKELLTLGIPIDSDPLRHFGFQRSKPCKKY